MQYKSLSHKAIDFYQKIFSPFIPVKSEMADEDAQKQMYDFLYSILERLSENPGIIDLPDVPDERFIGMQKNNPELKKILKKFHRK